MLEVVPTLIDTEENEQMDLLPEEDEVKNVVFLLNGTSVAGLDSFTGLFFQTCWDVLASDVTNVVRAFFCGQVLPRFITHTNLVLLPKKLDVRTFSDLRPISLNCFINKVISRVLHDRLVQVLPKIISPNQSDFVKGRSI